MAVPDIADENGVTPLMRAARDNDSSAIAAMVTAGHNIDAIDNAGNSALIHAARNGAEEAALMLMFHKADLNAADTQGQTALIMAARTSMQLIVERWATMGGPMDAQEKETGQTALMVAAAMNDVWASCRLVEAGADFEKITDKNGATGFSLAKQHFTSGDFTFFMNAVNLRHTAEQVAAQAAAATQKRLADDIANSAGSLTHPVSAPKTASFRRKTPGHAG
jgi:ankyrin repeat protein